MGFWAKNEEREFERYTLDVHLYIFCAFKMGKSHRGRRGHREKEVDRIQDKGGRSQKSGIRRAGEVESTKGEVRKYKVLRPKYERKKVQSTKGEGRKGG